MHPKVSIKQDKVPASEPYCQVLNALRECPNLFDCSLGVLHLERQQCVTKTTRYVKDETQRLHPTNKLTCSSLSRSSS